MPSLKYKINSSFFKKIKPSYKLIINISNEFILQRIFFFKIYKKKKCNSISREPQF